MRFDNIKVYNFADAMRGMRNPKNSWSKSDTFHGFEKDNNDFILMRTGNQDYRIINRDNEIVEFISVGPDDMRLAKTLIKGGSEHRKFLRQILVSVDITAPLYWWKEFDTYKVGTTANSTSTMHKVMSKPITKESFEIGDYKPEEAIYDISTLKNNEDGYHWHVEMMVDSLIEKLESIRQYYIYLGEWIKLEKDENKIKELTTKQKAVWKELIRWLPEGWLQTRTVTMNYENILSMVRQRKGHKLVEWSQDFMRFARSLPYSSDFIFVDEEN